MEIWKDIKGYDGVYKVSNKGNILSLKLKKERKLTPQKQNNGYLTVKLYKKGKSKMMSVHRIVALAFLDNINKYRCVNHLNRNRHDNNLDNLEWCTHKQNAEHSFKNGRVAWNKGKKSKGISLSKMGGKNPMARKVIDIVTGKKYNSLRDASRDLNIKSSTLTSRMRRNSKLNTLKYI